ncbi:MAG: DNA polymerase Y family protein, partial [Sciscionella sp.]
LRRRAAQERCPGLVIFAASQERDARSFEPVAAAVQELAPGIEVVYPGAVAVPVRGVAGYFGGEHAAAERIVDHVAHSTGVGCQVGVADGMFAAVLAARRCALVPRGRAADFLAPLGIGELGGEADRHRGSAGTERGELIDLLRRLGLRTLGAFAALPERDVASRFGADAVVAHRLAGGRCERPPIRRRQLPELAVTQEFDPAIERVSAAAFAARALAERLREVLGSHNLVCTRLGIHARTEHGEELTRVWRMADPATAGGIAERVRWQLEGWLSAPVEAAGRPSSGVRILRLEPEEVISGRALQLGLFGGNGIEGTADAEAASERAGRALVRVQALLGPDAVFTVVLGGGRHPGDQVRMVPWGDEPPDGGDQAQAWPGRLPRPSPATVPVEPPRAVVLDASGAEVGITGRHQITAAPCLVAVGAGAPRPVLGWAGPWPVDERWWEFGRGRRLARVQVVLAGSVFSGPVSSGPVSDGRVSGGGVSRGAVSGAAAGGCAGRRSGDSPADSWQSALLLVREGGRWVVEGVYD